MMQRPLEDWPDALEAVAAQCAQFTRVQVLRTTSSTQDHGRAAEVGSVVVAGRQTTGRGRLGRAWADTGDDGLAITFTAGESAPAFVSLAAALAAAEAVEEACTEACAAAPVVRLKWPNDLIVAARKLGGVLVERTNGRTVIGIGINCLQRQFPAALATKATSLALQGFTPDRCLLACRLVARMDRWICCDAPAVAEEFSRRDALRGSSARFVTPAGMVEGLVVAVDPQRGIVVRTSRGDQVLPPEQTSVFVDEDRGGIGPTTG